MSCKTVFTQSTAVGIVGRRWFEKTFMKTLDEERFVNEKARLPLLQGQIQLKMMKNAVIASSAKEWRNFCVDREKKMTFLRRIEEGIQNRDSSEAIEQKIASFRLLLPGIDFTEFREETMHKISGRKRVRTEQPKTEPTEPPVNDADIEPPNDTEIEPPDDEPKYKIICPNDGCNGFIAGSNYSCGLCNTKICKSCEIVMTSDHVCNEGDVATVTEKRRR
jgi:hypothetical protein